jgi:hypothetical protein
MRFRLGCAWQPLGRASAKSFGADWLCDTMERQLSDEDEVIGSALLLVRGHDAITSQRRDKAAAYLRAKRVQARLLCDCCAALNLAKPRALLYSVSPNWPQDG